MNDPKKHHYLPVFYLKAWANEHGKLCEFSRPYNEVSYKWRSPDGTGYQEYLYALPGVSPENAQIMEKHYMGLVDTFAAKAHQKLLQDGLDDITPDESLAWARFLYALIFRNPEQIARLQKQYDEHLLEMMEEVRLQYPGIRGPKNPESFDEFKAQFLNNPRNTSGNNIIPHMLNSKRVIPGIQSLRFWTARLKPFASPTFLTSDRPITMNNGLGKPEAHIVIPISPRVLFIAARTDWLYEQISAMTNAKLARLVNDKVSRQSHRYVYDTGTSQHLFISRRLGEKLPSTPFG